MTTRHKVVWTIRAILVGALLIEVGLYWRMKQAVRYQEKYASELDQMSRDLEKDLNFLSKELERKMTEANTKIMGQFQHLPTPTNGVTSSFHEKGYEDAWIQDIDKKEGLVLVTTIDSRVTIAFKPSAGDFKKFHVNWIAPVTFQCTKKKKGKCDFSSPYKLFVSNGLVEVKQLEFPKK